MTKQEPSSDAELEDRDSNDALKHNLNASKSAGEEGDIETTPEMTKSQKKRSRKRSNNQKRHENGQARATKHQGGLKVVR